MTSWNSFSIILICLSLLSVFGINCMQDSEIRDLHNYDDVITDRHNNAEININKLEKRIEQLESENKALIERTAHKEVKEE